MSNDALFDDHVSDYDSKFSHSWLGSYYRKRAQNIFSQYWQHDKQILELNAGTGEDAIHLAQLGNNVLATDISTSMLKTIEIKTKKEHLEKNISTQQLNIKNLGRFDENQFDGILSNFGGLNCINDWDKFAKNSFHILKESGIVVVCVMGPIVPWEWIWFSLKGQFSKAFRRTKGQCKWNNATIYYPSVSYFEKIMTSTSFTLLHREALGFLMPPPYTNSHAEKWKRCYSLLAKAEQSVCRFKVACRLSDHYMLVFKKINNGI